jgi:phospholipid N-methyltransferase
MSTSTRPIRKSQSRPIDFLLGFLKNPKEVGSVIPSSKFLIRKVVECMKVPEARVIAELGPGTGVLTHGILRRMRPDAKLVAIELNSKFAQLLRHDMHDVRLTVFEGSSTELERALEMAGEAQADVVVSGIPFSTMHHGAGRETMAAAKRVLRPGGRFVAYQFRSEVRNYGDPVFGPAETHPGFLNVPPMRVYVWRQKESGNGKRSAGGRV